MMFADWIERAMEMDGVSYLRTPEEELSWLVLYNMDVYCALIALLGILIVSVGLLMTLFLWRLPILLPTWSFAPSRAIKKNA